MAINLSDTISYTYIPNYANLENYPSQILISANFLYGSINVNSSNTLDYCRFDVNVNNETCTIYSKITSTNNLFIGFEEDYTYSKLVDSGFTIQLQIQFTRAGGDIHQYHYYNLNVDDNWVGQTDLTINISQWFTYNGAYVTANPLYVNFKLVPTNSYLHTIMSDSYNSAFDEGYEVGYFDGTSETTSPINNGLTSLGVVFNSVGNLLSHEIMPNVTIGGIMSIPLVAGLVISIIKILLK